jgi:inhibitor of cysteine peptidase
VSEQVTQADHGKTFEIQTGDELTVQLSENPTTGYRWGIDQAGEPVLALQHDDFSLPQEPLIGQGGQRVLTWVAQQPGQTQIRLKLWREWAGDASTVERFQIEIVVTDP